MKKVRECFHMLITAVICLMVSMVPGKNVTAAIVENNAASEILSTREKHMADRFTVCPLWPLGNPPMVYMGPIGLEPMTLCL